ncbi:hypothetical protein M231_03358 [Tremella mesenterica]|uniref:Uncharacterized protein n=1 Tax=Tremella mesenterica TaxID=5217 RepID=A0A4Q1BNF9_TREME|nr:hypothetical protein M231_03358 [Tremella mesenterica]
MSDRSIYCEPRSSPFPDLTDGPVLDFPLPPGMSSVVFPDFRLPSDLGNMEFSTPHSPQIRSAPLPRQTRGEEDGRHYPVGFGRHTTARTLFAPSLRLSSNSKRGLEEPTTPERPIKRTSLIPPKRPFREGDSPTKPFTPKSSRSKPTTPRSANPYYDPSRPQSPYHKPISPAVPRSPSIRSDASIYTPRSYTYRLGHTRHKSSPPRPTSGKVAKKYSFLPNFGSPSEDKRIRKWISPLNIKKSLAKANRRARGELAGYQELVEAVEREDQVTFATARAEKEAEAIERAEAQDKTQKQVYTLNAEVEDGASVEKAKDDQEDSHYRTQAQLRIQAKNRARTQALRQSIQARIATASAPIPDKPLLHPDFPAMSALLTETDPPPVAPPKDGARGRNAIPRLSVESLNLAIKLAKAIEETVAMHQEEQQQVYDEVISELGRMESDVQTVKGELARVEQQRDAASWELSQSRGLYQQLEDLHKQTCGEVRQLRRDLEQAQNQRQTVREEEWKSMLDKMKVERRERAALELQLRDLKDAKEVEEKRRQELEGRVDEAEFSQRALKEEGVRLMRELEKKSREMDDMEKAHKRFLNRI